MTKSIADVLDRAADLIEPEGAWTQGWFARDKDGRPTDKHASEAVCWCAAGAIARVGGDYLPLTVLEEEFQFRAPAIVSIQDWNDHPRRTQAEVVAKLREAAAKAREQGK